MSHHRAIPTTRPAARKWAWLQWVLLFSAWQSPIPWCHCHGTLAAEEATDRCWLAEHLHAYHPQAGLFANVFFDLHFHADFPTEPGDDSHESTPRKPARLPAPQIEFAAVSVPAPAICDVSFLATDELSPSVVVAPDGANTFFERYAPNLALPLRFGVLRS